MTLRYIRLSRGALLSFTVFAALQCGPPPRARKGWWAPMRANQARWAASVLAHAAWPRRRYTEAAIGPAGRMRAYLRGWAVVPANIRDMPDIPRDTGAGHTLRWEGRWVLRPARGWRAWRWAPAMHTNSRLGQIERDAAADWALDVLRIS